jgi:adenosylhomocysteine nucleosidase
LAIRSISNVCGEAYEALDGREQDLFATARLAADVTLGVIRRLAQA